MNTAMFADTLIITILGLYYFTVVQFAIFVLRKTNEKMTLPTARGFAYWGVGLVFIGVAVVLELHYLWGIALK
jgi:hypothetical protein